jgi:hypothetical protein
MDGSTGFRDRQAQDEVQPGAVWGLASISACWNSASVTPRGVKSPPGAQGPLTGSGFTVQGLGFRVLGFRVQGQGPLTRPPTTSTYCAPHLRATLLVER